MLYLIFGKDTFRSRRKLKEVFSQDEEGLRVWFDADTFVGESFGNFICSQSLFATNERRLSDYDNPCLHPNVWG